MTVRVWRNPRDGKWTLKTPEGEPSKHSFLRLGDVTFHVDEAGRQRHLYDPAVVKNIHAWAEGITLGAGGGEGRVYEQITYRPKEHGYFYTVEDERRIDVALFVRFNADGTVYAMGAL